MMTYLCVHVTSLWYRRSLKSFQNKNLCDNTQNIAKPCAQKYGGFTAFVSVEKRSVPEGINNLYDQCKLEVSHKAAAGDVPR